MSDEESIETLSLSTRTFNALWEDGLKTLGSVRALADHELLRLPNFGRKGLRELRDALGAQPAKPHRPDRHQFWMGFAAGMSLSNGHYDFYDRIMAEFMPLHKDTDQ